MRNGEKGDDGAKNDVAPIIHFAIDLWKDPWVADVGPEEIVQLKQAMPEVPTTEGFSAGERSLFRRWSIAKEKNYLVENADGEKIRLKRISQSTLDKRYRTGLNAFWAFLIGNAYIATVDGGLIRQLSQNDRKRSFRSQPIPFSFPKHGWPEGLSCKRLD
ncbi:MAG: hypothetical protein WDN50_01505 [Bradyrhizobium sp.]